MNNLSEFFLFGLFGALAVGPALMNLYLATLESSRLPFGELLGYFAGELLYFGAAVFAFEFHWMHSPAAKHALEFMAGGVFVYFAVYSIVRIGKKRAASRYAGFVS